MSSCRALTKFAGKPELNNLAAISKTYFMLCTGNEFEVEGYSAYRNRTVNKHLDKIKNQMRQIKDCSLKPEDKKKLREKLIEIINEQTH